MRQVAFKFDGDIVFDRVRHEISAILDGFERNGTVRYKRMTEDERCWFDDSFFSAFSRIALEVQRIATAITDGRTVEISTDVYSPLVEIAFPVAVEKRACALIIKQWFEQYAIPAVSDADAVTHDALRSITLVARPTTRKNTF